MAGMLVLKLLKNVKPHQQKFKLEKNGGDQKMKPNTEDGCRIPLQNLLNYSTDTLQQALPNTSTDRLISLQGILLRTPESRSIEHYWKVDGVLKKYYGEIRRNLLEDYVIFYHKLDGYEVGVEENIPGVELAADFLCKDMSFC